MKKLKPIITRDSWSKPLQAEIQSIFDEMVFGGVLSIVQDVRENATSGSALVRAIRSGLLRVREGWVRGTLSAAISKELRDAGAKWDPRRREWNVSGANLTPEVRRAVTLHEKQYSDLTNQFTMRIGEIEDGVQAELKLRDWNSQHTEEMMSREMRRTVTDALGVNPTMTTGQKALMRTEYKMNLDRSIKNFAAEKTEKLREIVQDFVTGGKTRAELIQAIKGQKKMSGERAKFIARQETALFTTKLKQAQYQSVGLDEYIWHTMGDGRVRDSHRALNRTKQRWSNPPLTDKDRHVHPGEDFNCRCQAAPIVEF